MEENGSAAVDGDSFEREEAKRARKVLENLYSEKGEEGVQTRRETLENRHEEGQKEVKVRKERRDAARRAFHAAERLAEKYGLDAQCGEVHFVAPYLENRWPSRYRTEAPSEDTPAHWRVGESDDGDKVLVATTVDGEDIFRVPLEATFEELREQAEDEWRRLKGEYLQAQEREKKRAIWLEVIKEIEDEIGFGSVETLMDGDASEIAEESQQGRKTVLETPEAYPEVILKAVLEWTDDDANQEKPFRSENQPSLCGHVSERLEEPASRSVSQETIKSRLRSIMDEMDVKLPHGPTNRLSYFQAREEIIEAMNEHDLV
jgi:hypothetical protein